MESRKKKFVTFFYERDNLTDLGFLYFKEENYEKALLFFKLASKENPNAYTAEIHYAKCHFKLGRFR